VVLLVHAAEVVAGHLPAATPLAKTENGVETKALEDVVKDFPEPADPSFE
jgi:hypothetical protein